MTLDGSSVIIADGTSTELSAFYTPASTASCLASWAIRTGQERILEPSFGGGALIEAASTRARFVGNAGSPELVGFDIDKAAVESGQPIYDGEPIRLIWQDFLDVNPAEHGSFEVVLSNPPFTRNHSISPQRRAEIRDRFGTTGAAGIWVHFLLHSMSFLRQGVLAARLGIDRKTSTGWDELTKALSEVAYTGLASKYFRRWWARGLEEWWSEIAPDDPLAGTNITDRHAALSKRFKNLVPLQMRDDSPGQRPWRGCELTYEETGEFLPLDPSRAVRFRARMAISDWADPTYAALGPAIKHAEDPRLDAGDLKRLQSSLRKPNDSVE